MKIFRRKKYLAAILASLVAIGWLFSFAQAATLSIGTSSAAIKPGDTVTIRAIVNTQGAAINNAEGVVNFPKDLVEATSISSGRSVFSLWIAQPSFSNANGTISFNGGAPNPGFTGSGEIFSATFKAKKAGVATFYFSGGAIRENDGLGTDILTGQGSAQVNISTTVQPAEEKETKPATPKVPAVPVITSPTHPDQNAWYGAKTALFKWNLPSGVTAVQTLIGTKPDAVPNVTYKSAITQKEVNNLTDGIWYFHVRYQTAGGWSPVAHYRVNIESQPPKNLATTLLIDQDGKAQLSLKAEDSGSGISYYTVAIDNQLPIKIETSTMDLPVLALGPHSVVMTAYDKAGNKAGIATQISMEPKAAPVISSYPEKIKTGETIKLTGNSVYTGAKVKVVIKDLSGLETVGETTTDENGKFLFESGQVMLAGNYAVWSYLETSNGVKSPNSEFVNITAAEEAAPIIDLFAARNTAASVTPSQSAAGFTKALAAIWNNLAAICYIPAFAISIICLLSALLLFVLYRLFATKIKLKAAERLAKDSFMMLLESADNQVEILEKAGKGQKHSRQEAVALNKLKETISQMKFIKDKEKMK